MSGCDIRENHIVSWDRRGSFPTTTLTHMANKDEVAKPGEESKDVKYSLSVL